VTAAELGDRSGRRRACRIAEARFQLEPQLQSDLGLVCWIARARRSWYPRARQRWN